MSDTNVNLEDRETRAVPILVVDDESDHARMIVETLQEIDVPLTVQTVSSGEEAIAYLSGQGRFSDREKFPFPFVVLLDLRMPGIGGFGVLRWMCVHPQVQAKTNLIALSSVQSQREIEVVYELGAKFFWSKSDPEILHERVRLLSESWQLRD